MPLLTPSDDNFLARAFGDVVRVSSVGRGLTLPASETLEPLWRWGTGEGVQSVACDGHYVCVRLDAQALDASVGDVFAIDLWAQDTPDGSGVLLGTATWSPPAWSPGGLVTLLVHAGVPARLWGLRGRMVSETARRVVFTATHCNLVCAGVGVIARGEGVTP
jgi:hypothetical protein